MRSPARILCESTRELDLSKSLRHNRWQRTRFLLISLSLSTALRAADHPAFPEKGDARKGKAIFTTVCAACHGERGEGKKEIRSPSIASMPDWYVVPQLSKFKSGLRGDDPEKDPQGHLMSAIGKTLEPEQMADVAAYVASLPQVTPGELTLPSADLDNGQYIFQARCMECHRYNASGEMTFGSPPLTGRQHWYLADQIRKFKAGTRGAKKGDEKGAKMVFTSNFIEDEEDLRDVMAYIMTLNPEPEAKAPETPAKESQTQSPFKEPSSKSSE